MPAFATAKLVELDSDFKTVRTNGRTAVVQFNPETLKVSYSNHLATADKDASGKSTDGSGALQLVAQGSTKLSLTLWFDVTAPMPDGQPPVDDVRRLTRRVVDLMNPRPTDEPQKFIAPAVRFAWGSFSFAGLIDSIEESLEYFSEQGVPLRASIGLAMSQQNILVPASSKAPTLAAGPRAGTRPLVAAPGGASLQSLAANAGSAGDWQRIAAANGIENPRLLPAGQLLDLNASGLPGAPS